MAPQPVCDPRTRFRLAKILQAALARCYGQTQRNAAEHAWLDLQRLSRRLQAMQKALRGWELAKERNWQGAAGRQQRLLQELLQATPGMVLRSSLLAEPPPVVELASVADLCRDLAALNDEFEDSLLFDREAKTVSVTTPAIVLEDVDLGAFRITWHWNEATQPDYRIRALHPNRSHDGHPHPHVSDEHLCAGEGKHLLKAAMKEGRVLDFFLIVNQILHTYSQGSAYCELSDWEGEKKTCNDCGDDTSEEGGQTCRRCNEWVCDECSGHCASCDETCCSDCVYECEDCDERICGGCFRLCRSCGDKLCRSCAEVADRYCSSCEEDRQAAEEEEPEDEEDDPGCDDDSDLEDEDVEDEEAEEAELYTEETEPESEDHADEPTPATAAQTDAAL